MTRRGAAPGELPVELPDTFDLSLNFATAEALRATIPVTIRQQATRFYP